MTDHRDFTPPRKRHSYLAVDEMRLLDWWCAALQRSFGKIPYLVGSALTRPDYRDVDIRICITDEQLRDLPLLRRDFNMMLSLWGQRATGLPIDCQVQNQAEWVEYDGPVSPRGTISSPVAALGSGESSAAAGFDVLAKQREWGDLVPSNADDEITDAEVVDDELLALEERIRADGRSR